MILVMDSSRRGELRVALLNGTYVRIVKKFDTPGSGQLLNVVEEALLKRGATINQLTGIVVAIGPGPFSALRAAVSIANAFGYALHIPVVGIVGDMDLRALAEKGKVRLRRARIGARIVPHYGSPAHITKAKRRA